MCHPRNSLYHGLKREDDIWPWVWVAIIVASINIKVLLFTSAQMGLETRLAKLEYVWHRMVCRLGNWATRHFVQHWHPHYLPMKGQAPVPLTIFRSNSNSMEICNAVVHNILDRSQRNSVHVPTVTPSWRDLCKIVAWSVERILNKSTANLDRILNSIELLLVRPAPVSSPLLLWCYKQWTSRYRIYPTTPH